MNEEEGKKAKDKSRLDAIIIEPEKIIELSIYDKVRKRLLARFSIYLAIAGLVIAIILTTIPYLVAVTSYDAKLTLDVTKELIKRNQESLTELENYQFEIETLKSDIDYAKKEAKNFSDEQQYDITEAMKDSLTIAEIRNQIKSIVAVLKDFKLTINQKTKLEEIECALTDMNKKVEEIKNRIDYRNYKIHINIENSELLEKELRDLGFFIIPRETRYHYTYEKLQQISLGGSIPLDVVKIIISRVRKYFSTRNLKFKYIRLRELGDPLDNRITFGVRDNLERNWYPLTDKDFDKLLKIDNIEEFHAFIRAFKKK